MKTTTTTTTTSLSTIVTENRYLANEQLLRKSFADFKSYKAYVQVCNALARASWNVYTGAGEQQDIISCATAGLFDLFGITAKADDAMQNRMQLTCIHFTRAKSATMKNAERALRDARKGVRALEQELEKNPDDDAKKTALDTAKKLVTTCSDRVDELKELPNHVWFDAEPMLDANGNASKRCRKLIEDTIADIIAERKLMTYEDIILEKELAKAAKKAKKKAQKKIAEQKTEQKTEQEKA